MCCAACAAGQKNSRRLQHKQKIFTAGQKYICALRWMQCGKSSAAEKFHFVNFEFSTINKLSGVMVLAGVGYRGRYVGMNVAGTNVAGDVVAGRGAPMASWRTLQMLLPRTRCITRNVWHSQFQTTENCFVVVVPRENNFPVTLTKNMVMNKEPQKIDSNFQFRLGWHKC